MEAKEVKPYGLERLKDATMMLAVLQRSVTIGELERADNLRAIIDAYEDLYEEISRGTHTVVTDPIKGEVFNCWTLGIKP